MYFVFTLRNGYGCTFSRFDRRSGTTTMVSQDSRVFSVSRPKNTLSIESVLHVRNATDTDSGTYQCRAVSPDDPDINASASQVGSIGESWSWLGC